MHLSIQPQKNGITRRTFLQAAGAGLAAGSGFAWANPNPIMEACILIWLSGGVSQLDTFNPKPGAPSIIRGRFQPRNSSIRGVQICEHLPRIAEILEYTTLIRTLTCDETNHDRAAHYLLTGNRPDGSLLFPTLSSQICRGRKSANNIPVEMIIPTQPDGISVKYLSRLYKLSSESTLSPNIHLISDFTAPPSRYGNTPLGTAGFQAIRAMASGVKCVTIVDEGWDLHDDLFNQYETVKLPELDRAYSGMWYDLQRSGLLQSTLVVLMGEFGRSPKINAYGGRDHWPHTGCVLLAGGTMQKGEVIGGTDEFGAKPISQPVSPADLNQLILAAMKIERTVV